MTKLRVLDLFSGIGGFSLGLERTGGFETVAFCEIEEYPRKVLAKHWPDVPQFHDVRKLKGSDVGAVDVICGGYPCQPFSTAGKRRGQEDDRHLWPEFNRLVAELRPAWVIGENVAGHISMGLDDVLFDLEGQGYACRTFVIPACAVDAKQRRDRCWTLAHASSERRGKTGDDCQRPEERASSAGAVGNSKRCADFILTKGTERVARNNVVSERRHEKANEPNGSGSYVADAGFVRLSEQGQPGRSSNSAAARKRQEHRAFNDCVWSAEPAVGRMAHGVPRGVDRLRALGNAVVPQIPEMLGRAILEAETQQ